MTLSLVGYVINVTNKTIVLTGIDEKKWISLDKSYWAADMCRRVSKNKKTCTIRVNSKTTYIKHGKACGVLDMDGCHVKVIANAKKYVFPSDGSSVTGWCINASSIKSVAI